MLLILEELHKKHLEYIKTLDIQVAKEFCKASVDFFNKGINRKIYVSAAQKLNIDSKCIQESIESIMYLLLEASKFNLNTSDFKNSLNLLGFNEDLEEYLIECYEQLKPILFRNDTLLTGLPFYKDFEWRFDVKIASRSLNKQIEPSLLVKLTSTTTTGKDVQVVDEARLLEIHPTTLLHITRNLQQALQQLNDPQYQRASRNL